MKKIISLVLALLLLTLTACGSSSSTASPAPSTSASSETVEEVDKTEEVDMPVEETIVSGDINIYVLNGPTGIGAMNLWNLSDNGSTLNNYNFTMPGENTEIVAAISKGEADIACVATNLASTLYNKTNGGISVLAVNTLGVLSILSNSDETISSITDLKGKTIYSPGQGANPEYILKYVLSKNGLDPEKDVAINFVSEGSELLTVWANEPDAVILAPQPVATTLLMKNENAKKIFDMTKEWENISEDGSALMMGCVIVRNEYLQNNEDAVHQFLKEYEASILAANTDVSSTASLCEQYGLIPKAPIAMKAIPECGLCFITGNDMKTQLSGYLNIMFDSNPASVGGAVPGDDFYYAYES